MKHKHVCTILVIVSLLMAVHINAQTWAFRAGFGEIAAGSERVNGITMDATGNIYITGSYSGDIDFGTGALPVAIGTDGFITKFNAAGVCQWVVRFGGSPTAVDQGLGIVTDGTSVFVAGSFNQNMTVGTSPTVYNAVGIIDGLIIKLNASTGAVNWVTTFGGTSSDMAQAICLDGSGNPYISGNFFVSANFGPFTRNANGGTGSDLFVGRLNGGTGAFEWVSTGGSAADNDNPGGSGIAYVASLNVVVVSGSYVDVAPTYSTTSPASSVTLPFTNVIDLCLLELDAGDGRFLSGVGIGGAGSEEGLSICYDPTTQNIALAGYFSSSSLTFGTTPAITNPNGNDDGLYALYNPTTNAFVWSRAFGGSAGQDRVRGIASNANGGLLMVGHFRGTLVLPTPSGSTSITNTRTNGDDIFLARVRTSDGAGQLLAHGAGDNFNTISNQGWAVTANSSGVAWIGGSYASNVTFAPLAVLPPSGPTTADIFIARFNDPLPMTATQSQTAITCNIGCNGTATVTPSGGVPPFTYSWSPSGGSAATATGLCANSYTVTVNDAIHNQLTRNYTITEPVVNIPNATTNNTSFVVSLTNHIIADAACNLIARLVPNGASPVNGSLSARVWIQPSVPTFGSRPFVQRHYEKQPASNPLTATGRLTLYFTQAEFNNFNAHPAANPKLPTGPADAAGIANLRIAKYPGTSSNGTGLPGTYSTGPLIVDPPDADIVWNATRSRWEITINVAGFSGFIVQTTDVPLPVNLVSFIGHPVNNDVQLKWTTAGESDHDYFDVERSTDGRNYSAIGRLAGTNTTVEKDYQLQDPGAAQQNAAKLYYRLKSVSLTGKTEYSSVIMVYLGKTGSFITGILPNPFDSELKLTINAPKNGEVNINIADMNGRIIIRQQSKVQKGFSTIGVAGVEKLSGGVYTISVKFDGESGVYKVIKR